MCNLVGEISQLRKENRKLRRRLSTSTVCTSKHLSSSSSLLPSRSVIERVNAFLDRGSRRRNSSHNFLPKLITVGTTNGPANRMRNSLMSSGSSSGIFNNTHQKLLESYNGARERLSSPPKVGILYWAN